MDRLFVVSVFGQYIRFNLCRACWFKSGSICPWKGFWKEKTNSSIRMIINSLDFLECTHMYLVLCRFSARSPTCWRWPTSPSPSTSTAPSRRIFGRRSSGRCGRRRKTPWGRPSWGPCPAWKRPSGPHRDAPTLGPRRRPCLWLYDTTARSRGGTASHWRPEATRAREKRRLMRGNASFRPSSKRRTGPQLLKMGLSLSRRQPAFRRRPFKPCVYSECVPRPAVLVSAWS